MRNMLARVQRKKIVRKARNNKSASLRKDSQPLEETENKLKSRANNKISKTTKNPKNQ